jgi:hypothetical protein
MATFSELLAACAPSQDQRKRASFRYTYAPDPETGERPSFVAPKGTLPDALTAEGIADCFRGVEVTLASSTTFANGDRAPVRIPVSGDKAATVILRRHEVKVSKASKNRIAEVANGQPVNAA